MTARTLLQTLMILLGAGAVLASCAPSGPRGPVVFAASSLQAPLDELAENWSANGNEAPVLSYASSTALARQIEAGSVADLYISADAQWTDYIVAVGNLDVSSVKNLAANRVVLAAHRDSPHALDYDVMPTTAQILTNVTIASGDPDSVPLGRYTQEVLEAESIWDDIEPRLIRTSSAAAALRLVLLKEADFGFLYASDAERRDELVVYPTFESGLHSPIVYKALQLPSSGHPDTLAFLEYVASEDAASIFAKHGFETP